MKSPEELFDQVKRTKVMVEEGDFKLTIPELKEKYGVVYDQYLQELRELRRNLRRNPELIDDFSLQESDNGNSGMTRRDFFTGLASGAVTVVASAGIIEFIARNAHEEKMTVDKNNPILAAQSQNGMIFKSDFGDPNTDTGSVEQVILFPSSDDPNTEKEKSETLRLFQSDEISAREYKRRMIILESHKEQGFLSAEAREILTFEKLVLSIKEKGRQGIPTTLNFGDSSTSGWNSDICTDNAIKTARLLYGDVRSAHPELPETFEEYCLQSTPQDYRSRNYMQAMAAAAETLKQFPEFTEAVARNWSKVRDNIQSPFLTYDTYTDKSAKIDKGSHAVNLGVPGFSSAHLKSYVKRMLKKLKNNGVLEYVDAVTLYIGNNDCVYNGNQEDKYFIGEDTGLQLHGMGYVKEKFPKVFYTSRVSLENYEENLDEIIELIKSSGVQKIILTVPVVPIDWRPGLRSASDAQKVIDEQYAQNSVSKASKQLDAAREMYGDYISQSGEAEDGTEAFQLGQSALESDPMVPRIKRTYVQKLSSVAEKHRIGFVHLSPMLPARDMSHQNTSALNWENIAIDYCHPSEHSNILIAYAQSLAKDSKDPTEIRILARQELLKLGFGMDEALADAELNEIEEMCVVKIGASTEKYRRLSLPTRTKKKWGDTLFVSNPGRSI